MTPLREDRVPPQAPAPEKERTAIPSGETAPAPAVPARREGAPALAPPARQEGAPALGTPVSRAPVSRAPVSRAPVSRALVPGAPASGTPVSRASAAGATTLVGAPPAPGAPARADAADAAEVAALRFVVLGDSFSEGVGDRAAGAWRGWASLLADGLAGPGQRLEFVNLAVSGALSSDVAEDQAPRAIALRPHLASVVVGVNDTLRHTFDIGLFARRMDGVLGALDAAGAVLLTACLPDPGRMLGLPAPLARPLARRRRSVNAVVHALTARHGAVHLHLAEPAWTTDRALWSADRLHPGERGHRAVAGAFHRLLAERGLARGPAPSPSASEPPPTRAETALWLATAGTGWVLRRSRDLLPQLLLLAGEELLHRAAGAGTGPLDARAETALAEALAATMGE
ncbi:GDSL-type esterase/lipase family protein [Streptomyces sp. NPDC085460]|uniref:SGNH/GDSL hydrolase family protein n=1 Tax=Streptomyces sp. NPDC085460 TaxID=3365723 RepID=UPI0037D3EE69